MPDAITARCPLCQARGIEPTSRTLRCGDVVRAFSYACSHCGLLLDAPADMPDPQQFDTLFRDLCARKPPMAQPGDPFGCDIYTMRTIATRFGLAATPADAMQEEELRKPHGTLAADADLVPLRTLPPTAVSVGVMCSEREAGAVLETAPIYSSWAASVIVLIDRAGPTSEPRQESGDSFVRVFSRPLNGNFADQRNALQALCPTAWMFQLDADEDISPELGDSLTCLATLADRQGVVSIGLPRENLVDGQLSDLYPDLQYRLNRREISYEGIVHERPARVWQSSFIVLSGSIRHHLTAEHVARRSNAYETLKPGGGRLFEQNALQRPYEPHHPAFRYGRPRVGNKGFPSRFVALKPETFIVTSTSFRFRLSAQTALAIAFAATFLGNSPSLAQSSTVETIKSETRKLIAPITGKTDERLDEVARFDHQVTGVTVSEDNRIFVNFPRWSEDVPVSVAEVMKDGTIKPYPNDEWNAWRNARMSEVTPGDHFVSVQSVVADGKGSLWVVDPAAPNTEKTVKDGPKLVQIDLKTNSVKKVYPFSPDVAGPASYMNDVRLSPDGSFAYLTDSGMPGGLVVVDLKAGKAWRALSDDASTQMEKDAVVMTDGKPLKRPDGRQPMFNADGLALSNDGATLYWQAVTAKTMYRIDTALLQQAGTDPEVAKGKAEKFATTEPVDGLWTGKDDSIYLSAVGADAVKLLKPDGKIETVLTDSRLRWPDTFSQGPDGFIYVTASHIQDSPWFHPSGWANKDFTLFRFRPE